MRHLLLLAAVLLAAPSASAQWVFAGNFPDSDDSTKSIQNHGLAVSPDGKVWVQAYFPFTGDSITVDPAIVANNQAAGGSAARTCPNTTTNNCRVTALYVYNDDGTPASFSPLSIVTLPGGVADTLGGGVFGTGASRTFDWLSGRGLTSDADGNVYAGYGGGTTRLYKFDYEDGSVLDFVDLAQTDSRGAAGPAADDAGNIYVTGVFPGDPIAVYDPDLEYTGNVTDADFGFNRSTLALDDGLTVIALNYSADVSTIYQRDDEFDTTWDSTGTTFLGMAVESATVHPTTGNIWVSAGSPNPDDLPTGRYDDGAGNAGFYQTHTWYEFTEADVLSNESPVPLDSIVWVRPNNDGANGGRPRAIAFSPDGRTAYVGEYNINTPAVQKFVDTSVSNEPGMLADGTELKQNRPNPFSGSTEIAFKLANAGHVTLRVYDVMGREVATLADRQMAAGLQSVTFDATSLAAGTYLYSLDVDGERVSRRMLLAR